MPAYPEWSLLQTWVVVVEVGSISAAAHLLDISQAAASQRLKLLESSLGVDLLDRGRRPARPTRAGEQLFEQATRLLAQAGNMVESVRSLSRGKRNIVRVGCVDSFTGTLGPMLIHGLSGISRQIRLWSGITPVLDKQLEDSQLDLSVTTSATADKASVRKYKLFTEPYLLVTAQDLPLERLNSLQELAAHTSFIRYSSRSFIGAEIDRLLSAIDAQIERTYEFDNTDPVLSLVAAGLGFAISTPLCIWQSRHFVPQLRVTPLNRFMPRGRRTEIEASRTFYLAARESESDRLPSDARSVILTAMERLIRMEIAPALELPTAQLWQSSKH